MFDFTQVAEEIRNDGRGSSARTDGLPPDRAADVLRLIAGYKPAERQVKAGSDLFSPGENGDAIYGLVHGWIALYNLLADGRRQILQFALPGAVLAFVPAPGASMTYGAQALTHAVVSIIPHEQLGRIVRDCPDIGMRLAALIARDRNLAYDHLSSIGRRSAKERVAHLLLELFVRYRMRWPGHRIEEMHLPLTQEHIGDATGLTNVHVNRVLRDLRKDGILEFHYRRLRILNPDKLVEASAVNPAQLFHRPGVRPHNRSGSHNGHSGAPFTGPRTRHSAHG